MSSLQKLGFLYKTLPFRYKKMELLVLASDRV